MLCLQSIRIGVLMMFSDVIKLVSEVKAADEYGDIQVTRTERTVFATMQSISQSEYYQAQAVGLRPEVKFIIADWLDYQDEKIILYTPYASDMEYEYRVIRTYRDGFAIELVCVRGVDRPALESDELDPVPTEPTDPEEQPSEEGEGV